MWHWGLKDPMLSTRNRTSGMKVCPECHGQGRIEDEDGNIVTCPECHGSGVVDDHHDDDPGTIREPPG
jgi:DnaJ-class molecular chaperone